MSTKIFISIITQLIQNEARGLAKPRHHRRPCLKPPSHRQGESTGHFASFATALQIRSNPSLFPSGGRDSVGRVPTVYLTSAISSFLGIVSESKINNLLRCSRLEGSIPTRASSVSDFRFFFADPRREIFAAGASRILTTNIRYERAPSWWTYLITSTSDMAIRPSGTSACRRTER